jgi:hypothetical protein
VQDKACGYSGLRQMTKQNDERLRVDKAAVESTEALIAWVAEWALSIETGS